MKTSVKIFAVFVVATIAVSLTACKLNEPELQLTKNSLENTVWKSVMYEFYQKQDDIWVFKRKQKLSDINPIILYQFKDGYQWGVNKKWSYSLDPLNRTVTNDSWVSTIIRLSANEYVFEDDGFLAKYRNYLNRIPPLSLAQLKGKWEITDSKKYNRDNNMWENSGKEIGYWIEFEEGGKGKNSRDHNCNYTVNGNILTIECIYGNAFVLECTANKLVFVHQKKDPNGQYIKETFKRKK
ncbi:MAG: hypothetical protein GX102_11210 [Porphyromonadaceae bacterium]|jgi:hypothetical protein|nr:hypothetical protein [Porphyromonadaceae bacterium]